MNLNSLTNRQKEILCLIAQDKTNREIAQTLGISHKTVRQRVHEIYEQLGEIVNPREIIKRAYLEWVQSIGRLENR
jgi:DNA-binding NarL/FixJ family response regulator